MFQNQNYKNNIGGRKWFLNHNHIVIKKNPLLIFSKWAKFMNNTMIN